MSNPVTVIAPIKIAAGKTEKDLVEASDKFQKEFVDVEEGIVRRELVRKSNSEYLDIVQFRSRDDALALMEKEKESSVCHEFFSVMDMESDGESDDLELYESIRTYDKK